MTQSLTLKRGGFSLHGHHLQFKLRERETQLFKPFCQSLWTPRQWITMLHWGMDQGFIHLESLAVLASSPNELLWCGSRTHEHTHAVPVLWCFDWLLDFKVGEPAAGRGGATLPWPGGLLQDWRHRGQGTGAWNPPTVCLSHSSTEHKEHVRALDTWYAVVFTLFHILLFYHLIISFQCLVLSFTGIASQTDTALDGCTSNGPVVAGFWSVNDENASSHKSVYSFKNMNRLLDF